MKTYFEEFITYRALDVKFSARHNLGHLPDEVLDRAQFRNVCAKLDPNLVERLDQTTGLLGITKRDFIELALLDSLDRAENILHHEVDALSQYMVKETSANE